MKKTMTLTIRTFLATILSTVIFFVIVIIAYDGTNFLNSFVPFIPAFIGLGGAAPTAAALISAIACNCLFMFICKDDAPIFIGYFRCAWMIILASVTAYVVFTQSDLPIIWFWVLSVGLDIWFVYFEKKQRAERSKESTTK
ncbi:hypothetical protein ACTQ33_00900 [Candidatus Avoscillospira sp. LCP25S3_F1]|uniref:hypothetical protein n=1 Tax=Candidatus Avoscillospira sp. LCP25S3_F1 TaxID=3438825 RepID=UPI003F8F5563